MLNVDCPYEIICLLLCPLQIFPQAPVSDPPCLESNVHTSDTKSQFLFRDAASRLVTDEATFDLLDIIEFGLVKPHTDTFPAL